jgi:predicted Zn-dependent protease with MMP-like domain
VRDPSGCRSWVYEPLSIGISPGFFAGPQFRPGLTAVEYGTFERTEWVDGHQEIAVTNPTATWRRAYDGFDQCNTTPSATTVLTCTAPALSELPASWLTGTFAVVALIGLLLALLMVVYLSRPAGPVRRPRHFKKRQRDLAQTVHRGIEPELTPQDVKDLERRLRRVEKHMAPQLSESQHRWFYEHLAAGRHGLALEALARWLAELHAPLPAGLRSDLEWVAAGFDIERTILPILAADTKCGEIPPHAPSIDEGFDVPVGQFERFVAEALDALPEEFGKAMVNVNVSVEEEAPERDRFGQYQGIPLTMRWHRHWWIPPDRITIYRRTICAYCHSEDEVKAEVYRTVIHEIAHHFGLSDPRLTELGW